MRLHVFGREARIVAQARERQIVVDTDREVVLRLVLRQLVIDALDHRRREFLRRQAIAATDNLRGLERQLAGIFGQNRDHVLVQRLTGRTRLLATIENGNRLDRLRQSLQEGRAVERTEQANLDHANLFASLGQCIDGFLGHFRARTHHDDDLLGIGGAVIIKQVILTARQLRGAVHDRLHDARNGVVERLAGFTRLEEDVGVLRCTADLRTIRAQSRLAIGDQILVVEQALDRFVADRGDLAHLVRGTETVKEVHERHARLERGDLRNQCHVGNFLHRVRTEHRPAGRTTRHHVGVIAEDRQRMRRQRTSGYVHGRRGQLTRDLVHVRNHQQKALRRGKRRAKRARLQCTMQCAGRATLALKLLDDGLPAPDILLSFCMPLIGPLSHRGRGGNRINGYDFGKTIGYRSCSFVPIHDDHLLFTHFALPHKCGRRKNNRYSRSLKG